MNKIEKSGVGVGRILLSLLLAFTRGLFGGPLLDLGTEGPGACLGFLGCYSVLEELLSRQVSQQASQRSPEWEPISNADVRFVCLQV